MVWYLTKGSHKWSIHPLVRAWLRAGGLTRFVVIAAISFWLLVLATPVFAGIALIFGRGEFSQFIRGLPSILGWGVWIFWAIEAYMDRRTTRGDLKKLLASPNVVLATRGDYIGGHPQLPHGRFVYLTLGGMMENPQLNILLPQGSAREPLAFAMPVLDLQKTSEKTGKDDGDLGRTLASVALRSSFLVQHATLRIEYTAQAGRKQRVELSYFLGGNGEIQNWRNFIVCIQAEADTGQPPYGPWKSLPRGAPLVGDTNPVNPPVDNALPRIPPAGNPPADELPTANLPPSQWRKLT